MLRTRLLVLATSSLACTISTEPPAHVRPREGGPPSTAPAFEQPAAVAAAPAAAPAADPAAQAQRSPRAPADARALPTPAAGQPAVVTVSDPGKGAARNLRLAPALGTEARLTTTLSGTMEFSGDGKKLGDAALPRITVTWAAKVTSVADDGSRTIELSIEEASYDEAHPEARTAKAAGRAVATLGQVRASFVLDGSGTPGPMQTQIAPRSLNDLRPGVEAALMVVPLLFVPAPATPVGAGARWTSVSTLSLAEMELAQTAEYRIATQTEARTELAVSVKDELARRSAVVPGSRQLEDVEAQLQGSVTLGDALLPVAIDARLHAVMTSDTVSNGATTKSGLTLDLQITAGQDG